MTSLNRRIDDGQKLKVELRKLDDFFSKIRSLNFMDLEIQVTKNGATNDYKISLPNIFLIEFKEISDNLNLINTNSGLNRYEKLIHIAKWGDSKKKFDKLLWIITVSGSNHRVHITGKGLPLSFRRLGLGIKMYQRVIKEEGFITTVNPDSSGFSDMLWVNIISNEDFYSFVTESVIFTCLSQFPPIDFISKLSDLFSIYEKVEVYGKKDFHIKFDSEIKNSGLKSKLIDNTGN